MYFFLDFFVIGRCILKFRQALYVIAFNLCSNNLFDKGTKPIPVNNCLRVFFLGNKAILTLVKDIDIDLSVNSCFGKIFGIDPIKLLETLNLKYVLNHN